MVFTRVDNWGIYDQDEFNNKITLFENNGTGKIMDEFRCYFEAEIFNSPIIKGILVFRV